LESEIVYGEKSFTIGPQALKKKKKKKTRNAKVKIPKPSERGTGSGTEIVCKSTVFPSAPQISQIFTKNWLRNTKRK